MNVYKVKCAQHSSYTYVVVAKDIQSMCNLLKKYNKDLQPTWIEQVNEEDYIVLVQGQK